MIQANDGGAHVSLDGGAGRGRRIYNQPTAEFYRVTVDDQFPYRVYGAQQDNSTISVSSRPPRHPGPRRRLVRRWAAARAATSPSTRATPSWPIRGQLHRTDRPLRSRRRHTPATSSCTRRWPTARRPADLQLPLPVERPHPDLAPRPGRRLPHVAATCTGPATAGPTLGDDQPGPDPRRSREAAAAGRADPARPHRRRDLLDGLRPRRVAPRRRASCGPAPTTGASTSPGTTARPGRTSPRRTCPTAGRSTSSTSRGARPGAGHVAVYRYREDDFRPYVFATEDYGASWKLADRRQQRDSREPLRPGRARGPRSRGTALRRNRVRPLRLVRRRDSTGRRSSSTCPEVPITDLAVHRGDLVVATQGRSFWVLDDLTLLHQMTGRARGGDPAPVRAPTRAPPAADELLRRAATPGAPRTGTRTASISTTCSARRSRRTRTRS